MPSGEKIDLNYARQLAQNYAVSKLGTMIPSDDTRAVWFSRDVILQALGLSSETEENEVTGIRVYFGAYQSEPDFPKNPFDNDKMTLILVPTGTETMQIDRGGEQETAYLDIIIEDVSKVQPSYPTGPASDPNSIINEGQLAPPPSAGVVLGLLNW